MHVSMLSICSFLGRISSGMLTLSNLNILRADVLTDI